MGCLHAGRIPCRHAQRIGDSDHPSGKEKRHHHAGSFPHRPQPYGYDVALAPHCPLGPVALASCLQVDAVSYNAFIQEQSIGIHYNKDRSVLDYITNPEVFAFVDGKVHFKQKSGLGVDVNRDLIVEENKAPHSWKNPVWRHADGSVAEW